MPPLLAQEDYFLNYIYLCGYVGGGISGGQGSLRAWFPPSARLVLGTEVNLQLSDECLYWPSCVPSPWEEYCFYHLIMAELVNKCFRLFILDNDCHICIESYNEKFTIEITG